MSSLFGESVGAQRSVAAEAGREHPQIDFVALLELFDGSYEAVCDLLEIASASIVDDLQRFEAAVRHGDALATADAAHRLKGTCGSISAMRMRDVSASIERDARHAPLSADSPSIVHLQSAATSLRTAIVTFVRRTRDLRRDATS